ncbi:hypothetical protein PROFUN_17108, partial [Planoprotostelium fungivorum]
WAISNYVTDKHSVYGTIPRMLEDIIYVLRQEYHGIPEVLEKRFIERFHNSYKPEAVVNSFGNDRLGALITMLSIANIPTRRLNTGYEELQNYIKDMSYRGCIQLDDEGHIIILYHVLSLATTRFGIDMTIPSVTSRMVWQDFEKQFPPNLYKACSGHTKAYKCFAKNLQTDLRKQAFKTVVTIAVCENDLTQRDFVLAVPIPLAQLVFTSGVTLYGFNFTRVIRDLSLERANSAENPMRVGEWSRFLSIFDTHCRKLLRN